MQFFIDTANVAKIKEAWEAGLIDGVTTNPSLVSKEGREFRLLIKEICDIVKGPVNAECVTLSAKEIVREAQDLARIAPNIVVKIPMIPEGLKAVKILSKDGVHTNVTLCFSPTQALLAAKAGATYVSPFVGRFDDISQVGMDLVHQILEIYKNYNYPTQVIVASIRNPLHVVEAAMMGAHVATIPPHVLEQLMKHPLTDIGLERFLADWKKVK